MPRLFPAVALLTPFCLVGPVRTDAHASADTPPRTAAAESRVARFAVLGDAGMGDAGQYRVADALQKVCAERGCDFALYLGDNFYSSGVTSVDDEQFEHKFEQPYAGVDFPFHAVLGNHDFGLLPVLFWRTDYQVEYTNRSAKWHMPDHFYTFREGRADFIGLDTNMIMLGLEGSEDQDAWVDRTLTGIPTDHWRIAFGHHPYRSNGSHGNAGNYEGAWYDVTGIVNGTYVKDFFDDHLCGRVDVYFAGHDHNRQWLEPACGMELIVSGAGAKLTPMSHRDNNPTFWDDDTKAGFTWVELAGDVMTLAFYDDTGALDHQGRVRRNR